MSQHARKSSILILKADLTKEMIQELIYNEMCVFHEEYRQNLKKVVESRGRKYEKNKIVLAPQS